MVFKAKTEKRKKKKVHHGLNAGSSRNTVAGSDLSVSYLPPKFIK